MSNVAIKVENLSKAYQLGQIGTGTISRDLERWYARMRDKEDPFLRIGESNDQYTKGESDVVWSLKDINFEINQGDAVGIIGRNGAGKSTLLKILSKVTAPTTGKICGQGRIASLLEVGTGFHPELSGRENIFLNGAILGMRKKEIQRKLEEIVDFAGIERYLDTPVKRYSSGMYVRLAFAVAAHLESEILIVDEVLAVGDAEFQKKCLGKMSDVSKGEGRTVLFVSHNMNSIKQLCQKGILLDNGKIKNNGSTKEAIKAYVDTWTEQEQTLLLEKVHFDKNYINLTNFVINGSLSTVFILNKDVINIKIAGKLYHPIRANLEVKIFTSENELICFYSPGHFDNDLILLDAGNFKLEESIQFPKEIFNGRFIVSISLSQPNVETYLHIENISFEKSYIGNANKRIFNYSEVGFLKLNKYE
ncbi:ABC transporter ATP-binding protein [Pedobacter agri]|uniref:ABC transporter ATP-binding protein n=1 Tax=Pedobacter agri TaxID=454586 RepID=UPI00292EB7DC|nr:ABC transporter ATP-binding protein [Pedobacter agri]